MPKIFWVFVLTLPIIPNLWGIWHASRHEFPSAGERSAWMRVATFIPVLGGLAYLLFGRRRALRALK